jgi:hypothetical protein
MNLGKGQELGALLGDINSKSLIKCDVDKIADTQQV